MTQQPQSQAVIHDARNDVAVWMIEHGYVTGHGDTLDDLLKEIVTQAEQRIVAALPQCGVRSDGAYSELLNVLDIDGRNGYKTGEVAAKVIRDLLSALPPTGREDLDAWIEREYAGYGVAIRKNSEPPIPGEPFMSMKEAKELTRRAVAIATWPLAIPPTGKEGREALGSPALPSADREGGK